MAKKSKNKGNNFERKVAKLLSEWWGVQFHRTPLSGGIRWGQDNRVVGDIVVPQDCVFPFTIECKKREGWTLDNLLRGTGEIKEWWEQAVADNKRLGDNDKFPLLLFSRNFSPIFYMMHKEVWEKLQLEKRNYFITTLTGVGEEKENHDVVVGLFDDLMKLNKEDVLKKLSK